MIRLFALLLALLLHPLLASAQDNPELDSLVTDLNSRPPDDTLRLYTLRYLWRASRRDPDRAANYARQQIREATRMGHLVRLAEAHKFLAISIGDRGLSDSIRYHNEIALKYYEEAEDAFQIGIMSYNLSTDFQENGEFAKAEEFLERADLAFAGDSLFKQQAAVRVSMAKLNRLQNNNEAAVRNATKAYKLAEMAGDSSYLADARQEMAFNYQDLKDYETALKYHKANAAFYARSEDPYYAAIALLNTSSCYQMLGQHEASAEAGERALEIAEANGFQALEIDVLNIMGNSYWEQKKYRQAEEAFSNALPLFEGVGYDRVKAEILVYLSGVQSQTGSFVEARRNGLAGIALAEAQGQLELTHRAYGQLAIVESEAGNYQKAYDYMVLRQGYQDSLYQQQLAATVAELTLVFEKERQDRIINDQKNKLTLLEQEANITKLRNRNLWISLLAALALFGAILYSLRQRTQRQKLEKEQLSAQVVEQQRTLSAHALQMAQKGQLLDQLASELQAVKGERPDDRKKLDGMLRELSSEERIDQDWANFRTYFQGVHGDFEERLKAAAEQNLSPRELRLSALIKMQLNNQEIGSILGVSQDSLYKAKYRLRKKLPGAGEGELDKFIQEF